MIDRYRTLSLHDLGRFVTVHPMASSGILGAKRSPLALRSAAAKTYCTIRHNPDQHFSSNEIVDA
jgi:hypothetical protein